MKKTFTTMMPDQVGAFLAASRVFAVLGLNITRVSYNKAVDVHMLFIEAEGEEEAMAQATGQLRALGYLPDAENLGNVMLVEFQLKDVPGAVEPVLELISRFQINICYLSSQENGTQYQYFRMGLLVQDDDESAALLRAASQICGVKILNYNPSGIALDNTVFYMSFANRIAEQHHLREQEKRDLIVDSNLIMDMLTRQNSPPYKTFEYIGKFSDSLLRCGGEAFCPRVTRFGEDTDTPVTLLEPPCGSNVCVIETQAGLLCVDGGFACYHDETLAIVREQYPAFDETPKRMLLTHADVDHVGIIDVFDAVYLSQSCFDNFTLEAEGRPNLREKNPAHAPYVRISKLLAHYRRVSLENLRVIGGRCSGSDVLLEYIGKVTFGPLRFEAYEAMGGHVQGETVFVEREKHWVFPGDILVNLKGFTREQAAFNRLAPYLMTSVDTDAKLASAEREAIGQLLTPGEWTVFGAHGQPVKLKK